MFKHCVIVFFRLHGAVDRAAGRDPLRRGFRSAPVADVSDRHRGQYAAGSHHLFFARKVLVWGKDKRYIGKFFTFCLEKGEKAGRKLQAKAGRGLYWALLLFVGIPLPGTGAWTGTLAASLLDMDFKKSTLACAAGVLLAGAIMGGLSLLGVSAFGG